MIAKLAALTVVISALPAAANPMKIGSIHITDGGGAVTPKAPISYRCGARAVTVRYAESDTGVKRVNLTLDGGEIGLGADPAGSGVRWRTDGVNAAGKQIIWWTKGGEASLITHDPADTAGDRDVVLNCRPATTPAPAPMGGRTVVITSDDPNTSVAAVFLDRKPLHASGLGTPAATVTLAADAQEGGGVECDSTGLSIRLSNGVFYWPHVNLCDARFALKVPARKAPLPSPLPVPTAGFTWNTDGRGQDMMLYFGDTGSDRSTISTTCRQGSGHAEIDIYVNAGPNPRLDIYGRTLLLRYDMRSRPVGNDDQQEILDTVDLPMRNPFWAALKMGEKLPLRLGNTSFQMLDASTGRAPIAKFIAWCSGGVPGA